MQIWIEKTGCVCLAAIFVAISSTPTSSAVSTATLSVTAAVADTCEVSATALAFGTLSTTEDTTEISEGSIEVVCTSPKASVSIVLGSGSHAASGTRRMEFDTGGSPTYVPYSVFSDSSHSSEVSIDGTIYSGSIGAISPTTIPVYGKVPAGSYAQGTYTDSVVVTLNY